MKKNDIKNDKNNNDKSFAKVRLNWYIPTLINFLRKPYFTRFHI